MLIECTPKIHKVLQCCEPATVALLIVRQALIESDRKSKVPSKKVRDKGNEGDREKDSGGDTEQLLLSWAASAVSSAAVAAQAMERGNAKSVDSGSANSSTNSSSSSSSSSGKNRQREELYAVCRHPVILRLLQLLCGASFLLKKEEHTQDQDRLAEEDAEQQIRSLLMTLSPRHCERMFYPKLLPLRNHPTETETSGTACSSSLTSVDRGSTFHALTRQAMIISGSNSFLLDSGTDLVLYRTISTHSITPTPPVLLQEITKSPTPEDQPSPLPLSCPRPPLSGGVLSANNISVQGTVSLNINVNTSSAVTSRQNPQFETGVSSPPSTPGAKNKGEQETKWGGDRDGDESHSDPVVKDPSKPSPLVISLSQSPLWLPSELHRRLSLGPVPRLHCAEAGTSSACVFTSRLLEDTYKVGSKNGTDSQGQGFQGYLLNVVDSAALI